MTSLRMRSVFAGWRRCFWLSGRCFVAVTLIVAVTTGCRQPVAAPDIETAESAPAAEGTAESRLPKLLDLGAGKCIPCKKMAPILDELKEEYAGTFDVEFIDVWKTPEVAKQYGVQQIPTQIFFDSEGKELFRHAGFFSKENILEKWKEMGVDLEM